MDAPSRVPGQENEGDEQPSEIPIPGDDNAQETSDHGLPMLSPPEQEAETRHNLATVPFQPILKVLADLERDDPKFAFPAA
ncbi:hypothetical protein VN97_g12610 [Penicillium thymicola]|uniref:Uncharacterized protein n=1 Tax=Penicillium thymicola TaxID=293382 RepID=A0AAI9T5W8_PENTH|nr:hypothetical protein VN97_g12610 [Penicillium thymicola]